MAERVVMHIGSMKSGTTYLQGILTSGILDGTPAFYVGDRFGVQTKAVRRPKLWRTLADRALAQPGVGIYSQEFLSFAAAPKIRRLVRPFRGTPVDVIVTVRDQRLAMPAQWQSYVRNRGVDDWPTYVQALHATREAGAAQPRAARTFYRTHGVPSIVDRWIADPGVRSVSVVFVPPSGAEPSELWRRFCSAADLDLPLPPAASARSNESLGYASCDLLCRLNPRLLDIDSRRYRRLRTSMLEALLPLRPAEARPALDRAGEALARELNDAIIARVERGDVSVVGSLDELRAAAASEPPARIVPADADDVRRAASALWEACADAGPAPDVDLATLVEELGERLVRRAEAGSV